MLELQGVGKRYRLAEGEVVALDGIDVALAPGSFTTVVGRSGCGKTTLLRLIAGLVEPDRGRILRRGPADARIGVVFQEPRLMPWLTVADNVAFGLVGHHPPAEIAARTAAVLALVGLDGFRDARPAQLSGGMAQRVALARALVVEPALLLLDEPFAALDSFTRRALQGELVALWQARRPTVVFVTHDVEEAVLLGGTVLELDAGRLVGAEPVPLPYPRDPADPAVTIRRRDILARLVARATRPSSPVPTLPELSR